MCSSHRIIDNRIEKYDASIVIFSKYDCRNEDVLAEWSQGGGGPGQYCPGTPSDHPHSPCPAGRGVHMWAVGAAEPVQQPEQTR